MVFDLHGTTELTAELLNGGGVATETVRFANLMSFTCLKAFAFDQRNEPKDAHDLVYCLEHQPGGAEQAVAEFKEARAGKHADAVGEALHRLRARFMDPDPAQSYRRDGAVAVARFEDKDADVHDDEALRNLRILRQRRVADLMAGFPEPLIGPVGR